MSAGIDREHPIYFRSQNMFNKRSVVKCKKKSTNCADVYDIVNAGPDNRFTIKTGSGIL